MQIFHGTAPKPPVSDIHRAIFGFNADMAAKAPAPTLGGRKLLQGHDETVRAPLVAVIAVLQPDHPCARWL